MLCRDRSAGTRGLKRRLPGVAGTESAQPRDYAKNFFNS